MADTAYTRTLRRIAPAACAYHNVWFDPASIEDIRVALGRVDAFGIEGTGSYGAVVASFLRRHGHRVIEVNRGDRRSRQANGKSDTADAEAAARAVLAGTATTIPKSADGLAEMIRHTKVARDTARKGRTSAIITLKALIVNAPAELRESLDDLPDKSLIDRCAAFRPRGKDDTTSSAKCALRSLARRWLYLDEESGPTTSCWTRSQPKHPQHCTRATASAPTPPLSC